MTGAQGSQQQLPSVSNRGLHTRFRALCMAREPVPVPGPGFPHTDKVRGRLSEQGTAWMPVWFWEAPLGDRSPSAQSEGQVCVGTLQHPCWYSAGSRRVFNSLSFIYHKNHWPRTGPLAQICIYQHFQRKRTKKVWSLRTRRPRIQSQLDVSGLRVPEGWLVQDTASELAKGSRL